MSSRTEFTDASSTIPNQMQRGLVAGQVLYNGRVLSPHVAEIFNRRDDKTRAKTEKRLLELQQTMQNASGGSTELGGRVNSGNIDPLNETVSNEGGQVLGVETTAVKENPPQHFKGIKKLINDLKDVLSKSDFWDLPENMPVASEGMPSVPNATFGLAIRFNTLFTDGLATLTFLGNMRQQMLTTMDIHRGITFSGNTYYFTNFDVSRVVPGMKSFNIEKMRKQVAVLKDPECVYQVLMKDLKANMEASAMPTVSDEQKEALRLYEEGNNLTEKERQTAKLAQIALEKEKPVHDSNFVAASLMLASMEGLIAEVIKRSGEIERDYPSLPIATHSQNEASIRPILKTTILNAPRDTVKTLMELVIDTMNELSSVKVIGEAIEAACSRLVGQNNLPKAILDATKNLDWYATRISRNLLRLEMLEGTVTEAMNRLRIAVGQMVMETKERESLDSYLSGSSQVALPHFDTHLGALYLTAGAIVNDCLQRTPLGIPVDKIAITLQANSSVASDTIQMIRNDLERKYLGLALMRLVEVLSEKPGYLFGASHSSVSDRMGRIEKTAGTIALHRANAQAKKLELDRESVRSLRMEPLVMVDSVRSDKEEGVGVDTADLPLIPESGEYN